MLDSHFLGWLLLVKLTPLGRTSDKFTFVAVEGPELVTTMVYVRALPAKAGSTESFLVTTRSTEELSVVVSVATLLAVLVSVAVVSVVDTVATLLSVPRASGKTVALTVIVADAPEASAPMLTVKSSLFAATVSCAEVGTVTVPAVDVAELI